MEGGQGIPLLSGGQGRSRPPITSGLSWHQIQKDEQVGEALRRVKEAGLIPAYQSI
jgi:hypothetical protein